MKDLTHYFPSPTKQRHDPVAPMDNQNLRTTGDDIASEEEALIVGKSDTESEKKTPRKKTRSRVKIKISVNGSRTRRCDIIDSKDDVIDKTPSPFASGSNIRKTARRSVSDTECAVVLRKHANGDDGSPREETANAFEVMMTRGKPPRYKILQTPSPSEAELELAKSKEYRIALKERKQRLVALADRKGYSKRKHADLEEAELIENELKKRAKLFRREDDERQSKTDSGGELTGREKAEVRTPRTKAKWTMKVKLQTHSDEGETEEADGNLSDGDYIFTPKSKVKFDRDRRRRTSGETKSQTGERKSGRRKKDNFTIDCSDSKSGSSASDVRIPGRLGLEKQAEDESVDIPKETKRSPVQESVKKSAVPDVKLISVIWPEDIIADVNRTEIENTQVSDAMKKLAPLFIKKPKSNPVAKEARRSFLQSGIPENVKKASLEQKNCRSDIGYSSMPFPDVSHVGQTLSEADSNEFRESGRSTLYRYKLDLEPVAVSLDSSHFRSLSDLGKAGDGARKTEFQDIVRVDETNLEDTLRELESRCSDVRTMWANISSMSDRTPKKQQKKRTKKTKVQGKRNSTENENLDSPNPTWTCKYKPTSSAQIVGNDAAIGKLRNWLTGWRLPSPNDDRSSGDEFYSSDSSSSGCYENNQVAVLLGPYGSGKTASVYAIAEELGYRVLEVNASSRRTGKKILTNFQEATKSHRVKRNRQNTLLSPVKKKAAEKKVPQNSLILIEDVDVIFDEDEGFVSATCQLAANTRRPIVLTCRETCPHLNKMAQRQLLIHFQAATGSGVSTLLELISLAESGCRLPESCLKMLLRNGDLRQSLLQLQYILLSGPPSTSQFFRNEPANLWQDARSLLYKPAVKRSKKYRKESAEKNDAVEEDAKEVKELAAKLDCVLLVSLLTEVENPAPSPWKRKPNPSLSLVQDFQPYSHSEELSNEIADWLRRATLGTEQPRNLEAEANLSVKRNVKLGIDIALSQAVTQTLEHRSKSTDYLPVIRTICRAEEERARVNTKRSKRFHNYLHGLNVASTSSNILAAASSVFKDKFP